MNTNNIDNIERTKQLTRQMLRLARSSEQPITELAKPIDEAISTLLDEARIESKIEEYNRRLDEVVHYSNHVGILHQDWEEYETKRRLYLESKISEFTQLKNERK